MIIHTNLRPLLQQQQQGGLQVLELSGFPLYVLLYIIGYVRNKINIPVQSQEPSKHSPQLQYDICNNKRGLFIEFIINLVTR